MVFFFVGMPQFDDVPELTDAEIQAMSATLVRVREALAVIVEREREHAQGLIDNRGLTRAGLDAAADLMGIPPVTDEEWADVGGEAGPVNDSC